MKKFKRYIAILLSVVMILLIIPLTASAAEYTGKCGDNLTWSFDESTGTLTISGEGAMYHCITDEQPWLNFNIKHVVIDDGVTTIGSGTFYYPYSLKYCTVKTITISDSVTTIGNDAFRDCHALEQLTIGNGVTTIGMDAFRGCGRITTLTIPDSVKVIDHLAFCDCTGLTSVELGNGVETIGSSAFYNCSKLKTVTIPANVKNISALAFDSCNSLTSIIVDSKNKYYSSDEYGVLYNKDKTTLVFYPLGNPTEVYRIPEGVTTIGSHAFDCGYPPVKDNIYALIFPESLMVIEGRAFYNCTGPSRIYFEGSKEQWEAIDIGGGNDSVNDARVYFDFNGVITARYAYTSGDFNATTTLDINTGTFIISGTGQITGFFTIGGYLDHFSPFIKTLVISDGITLIDQLEFSDFSNLETVILPQSITKIHKEAFEDCPQIKDVYYSGTEEQWKVIAKAEFPNATIHYNCCETHNYVPIETKATCMVPGNITYVCASCRAHYVYEYIKPIGYHSYTQTEAHATCTEHGSTKYTCDKCGFYYYDYTANPTGHSFNEDGVCQVCGEKEVSNNHINTQKLSIESVLAMVMSFLSKLFGIFSVA